MMETICFIGGILLLLLFAFLGLGLLIMCIMAFVGQFTARGNGGDDW
jgi:hypothetical protein